MSTYYNVRDHGAVGDGVTDDTVALQDALNAAFGSGATDCVVFMPRGTYRITATLIKPPGVSMLGEGTGGWLPATDGDYLNFYNLDTGTNILCTGAATKSYTLDWASNNDFAGYVHTNTQREFDLDKTFALSDWTNKDASAGTSATLNLFSVGIFCPGSIDGGSLSNFRLVINNPDSNFTPALYNVANYGNGDSSSTKYYELGDSWDVGIYNACQFKLRMDNVQVVGYWRKAALLMSNTGYSAPFTRTGTLVHNSAIASGKITSLSSLTGIYPGMLVTGGTIISGTRVVSIDPVTSTVYLSNNVTSAAPTTLTFGGINVEFGVNEQTYYNDCIFQGLVGVTIRGGDTYGIIYQTVADPSRSLGATTTATGTLTGTTTISSLVTTGIYPGMIVTGIGINANTTVVSVGASSCVVSVATGSGTNSLTFKNAATITIPWSPSHRWGVANTGGKANGFTYTGTAYNVSVPAWAAATLVTNGAAVSNAGIEYVLSTYGGAAVTTGSVAPTNSYAAGPQSLLDSLGRALIYTPITVTAWAASTAVTDGATLSSGGVKYILTTYNGTAVTTGTVAPSNTYTAGPQTLVDSTGNDLIYTPLPPGRLTLLGCSSKGGTALEDTVGIVRTLGPSNSVFSRCKITSLEHTSKLAAYNPLFGSPLSPGTAVEIHGYPDRGITFMYCTIYSLDPVLGFYGHCQNVFHFDCHWETKRNDPGVVRVKVVSAVSETLPKSGIQTINGIMVRPTGNLQGKPDLVWLSNQTPSSDNGIYSVNTGTWTKLADTVPTIPTGYTIFVLNGVPSGSPSSINTYRWNGTAFAPYTYSAGQVVVKQESAPGGGNYIGGLMIAGGAPKHTYYEPYRSNLVPIDLRFIHTSSDSNALDKGPLEPALSQFRQSAIPLDLGVGVYVPPTGGNVFNPYNYWSDTYDISTQPIRALKLYADSPYGYGPGDWNILNSSGQTLISTDTKGITFQSGVGLGFQRVAATTKTGLVTLGSGGTATVNTKGVTANSCIFYTLTTLSGTVTVAPYTLATDITAGVSFVVRGGSADRSTYRFLIMEFY